MGPTASGKSDLAERVAASLGAVLLNADAFQIYRWMDIGTAKPPLELRNRYRLLDLRDPNEGFGLGEWITLAIQELQSAWQAQKSVVVVGGTGLYIRALFEGYTGLSGPPEPQLRASLSARLQEDGIAALAEELTRRAPEVAASTDLKNPQRVLRSLEKLEPSSRSIPTDIPPFRKLKFAIERDPDALRVKIQDRTDQMLRSGWVEEVRDLLDRGFGGNDPGFRAHGYRGIVTHLRGEMEYDLLLERTVLEVRQYAKRQRTWLRREPNLNWLPDENCEALAHKVLNGLEVG